MRKLAAGVVLLLTAPSPAPAEVVLDGSFGSSDSIDLVAGEYAITDVLGCYAGVQGCGVAADNLFHSFSLFDVGPGETAHFSASLGTPRRVIARVTGGSRSQINGMLRSSIAGADLYLLNASGISFGDGADLDVSGSFYTSTADRLRFESGADLLVGDATPEPILSTAAPAAFGFTSAGPERLIEIARTRALSVGEDETLSIVGGDVFISGQPGFGVSDVIAAPGASLEIAAAAGAIDIPVALDDLALETLDPAALGLVAITAAATVDMSGAGETASGRVVIRGGEFMLDANAQILARNDSEAAAVGPIDIAVSGDLVLDGSNTRIQSWTAGAGRAGDVRLSGDRVLLRNGADLNLINGQLTGALQSGAGPDAALSGRIVGLDNAAISVQSRSAGDAGSVALLAREAIDLENGASVISDLRAGSTGDGGVLSLGGVLPLDSPEISVAGNAQVSTLNAGSGTGAAITGSAETLAVTNGGGIVSRASNASGAAGVVHLDTRTLTVSDAGRITSDTASGRGGAIEVVADHMLVSNATDRAEGTFVEAKNGGSITLDVTRLELLHGGQIFTRTEGAVAAGALRVRGADFVSASGKDAGRLPSGLFTRSGTENNHTATGTGGLLEIDTRVLEVDDGAELSSTTFAVGKAGSVEIDASERISVRGGANGFSLISASAGPGATGAGGTIEMHTDLLELRDGGRITTSTTGVGDAGRIDAHARVIAMSGADPATGQNRSGFFSRSNTPADPTGGDGGAVALRASEAIWMADGAQLSTSSSGGGIAGDITVDAGSQLWMEDSTITTQALSSSGGNVKVAAGGLVYLEDSAIETDVLGGAGGGGDVTIDPVHTVLQRSHITARAVTGAGGNISIVTDYFFPSGESFLDASSQLGIDGTINTTPPDTDVIGSLAALPADYLDASSQLERDCAARTARSGSFVVQPRNEPRPPPDAAFEPSEVQQCPPKEPTR